jgi:hypothetical protein
LLAVCRRSNLSSPTRVPVAAQPVKERSGCHRPTAPSAYNNVFCSPLASVFAFLKFKSG